MLSRALGEAGYRVSVASCASEALAAVSKEASAPDLLITDVVKDGGFAAYGLGLVGLPALLTGGRRPLGRELQILFVLAVAVISAGAATGSYGLARAMPVAMLPLHLALASYLAERAKRWRPYAAVALIACCVGLYGESAGLIRAYWGDASPATLRA